MKILVLGINFHPERVGIGVYTTAMCKYLSRKGHQITVFTGVPYYPDWKKYRQHRWILFKNDKIEQIKIRRSYLYVPKKVSAITRVLHEFSFLCSSFLNILFSSKPDLIITISPPLGLGFVAFIISKIKRAPFLFHVQDLQPDIAFELGMLRSKPLCMILYWCEKFIYTHAHCVSSISEKMCEKIRLKGVPQENIFLFPNWADSYISHNNIRINGYRKKLNISPEKKIVLYSGNIGKKQDFNIIISAAEHLSKNRNDILFVISGNGALEKEVKSQCATRKLTNVIFFDIQAKDVFYNMLYDANVCLIPQKASVSDLVFPSKLMNIMALGKPIVATTPDGSQLDRIVKKAQCGITVEPGNSQLFSQALLKIIENEGQILYGMNGKQYAREHFLEEKIINNFINEISVKVFH